MMFTIGANLVVAWIAGLVTSYTVGGFIYVALVLGILLLMWAASENRGRVPERIGARSEARDRAFDVHTRYRHSAE